MVGAVSYLHGLWKGLSSGLDGGIEPVGQRGRDKDMGTKYAEAPEVDIYGGWKPRQVCWFGECDWTDFRYLKRSLSVHLELDNQAWVLVAGLLFAQAGYMSSFVCGE